MSDNGLTFANASIDMPVNSMFLERIYTDGFTENQVLMAIASPGLKVMTVPA
ncbi:hypothetical protein [Budvicia aquatica]|uniref:Uncharacterized protein n=1 Tax=Budvicia aquatica TaxID=82979 RepID=A0A484ZBH4_9GAMM|nr:hypothetical protein [Budvicia aquatica]VFS45295.1 Uncharacterised protein [Budvicia aquatica]